LFSSEATNGGELASSVDTTIEALKMRVRIKMQDDYGALLKPRPQPMVATVKSASTGRELVVASSSTSSFSGASPVNPSVAFSKPTSVRKRNRETENEQQKHEIVRDELSLIAFFALSPFIFHHHHYYRAVFNVLVLRFPTSLKVTTKTQASTSCHRRSGRW
jgi:hypothetical protein